MNINELHNEAMELAEQADAARKAGDADTAKSLYTLAFDKEASAAAHVKIDMEPTRSVLLRSAASLAMEAGAHLAAEKLIGIALAGQAPEEIREELRDLFETINFRRHLAVHDTQLREGDLQLSLAGDAVGYGLISADEYIPRVKTTEALLVRTAERRRGIKFRENGPPTKIITQGYPIFLSAGLAASFAVTMRIGGPTKQMPLFETNDTEVVDELLYCLRLFDDERRGELSKRINNPAYYRNFVQNAKHISPDGKRIKTVGFTATAGDKLTQVALRKVPSEQWTQSKAKSGRERTVRITGVLTEAVKRDNKNLIGLRDENGTVRHVHVRPELMVDIVRPLWETKVTIVGRERNGVIILQDVQQLKDED